MLGVASAVARRRGSSPPRQPRVDVRDDELARAWSVAWAAMSPRRVPWPDLGLVETSTGAVLSTSELADLAARGALRLVPPNTRGRPLDETRPALRADERLARALARYGEVEDFAAGLVAETEGHRRRTAVPRKRSVPVGLDVLIQLPAPEGREGFLVVTTDGQGEVDRHIGWRLVDRRKTPGPIALAGAISDDALSANVLFTAIERNAAAEALDEALLLASREALGKLLDLAEGSAEGLSKVRPVLLNNMGRLFRSRDDVLRARGYAGRLADLPLLPGGEGAPRSLRAVAKLAEEHGASRLRWSPAPARSLHPPPFIVASAQDHARLAPLLGGTWQPEQAEREHAMALARDRAPQPLPAPRGRLLAVAEGEERGVRWHLGLRVELDARETLDWRSGGAVIKGVVLNLRGLVGTVELPAELLDEDLSRARLQKRHERILRDAYSALVAEAAPRVLEGFWMRRELVSLIAAARVSKGVPLPPFDGAVRAWLRAPLLETADGPASIHAVTERARRATKLLMGQLDPEALARLDLDPVPPAVADTRANRALLVAAGCEQLLVDARTWLRGETRRQAEAAEAAERARAKERVQRLESDVNEAIGRLLSGAPSARKRKAGARERQPPSRFLDAALATDSSLHVVALAWWQAAAEQAEHGDVDAFQRLTQRTVDLLREELEEIEGG